MKRRKFLKSAGAVTGGILAGVGQATAESSISSTPVSGSQPNILFILVDELRYPTVFPSGISDPGQFIQTFMPNLYKVWKAGVKFGNYHTASNACTPARGTLITGLYSQQSWLLTTIVAKPSPTYPGIAKLQPVLNDNYPTYGKLLRAAGYTTPYCGKWHVSLPGLSQTGLESYGFSYLSNPDPTGSNLQGTYGGTSTDGQQIYHNDAYTANEAITFLQGRKPSDSPWCLTVGFVNPHDREFFPAGTEFETVTNLFSNSGYSQFSDYSKSGPEVPWGTNALKSPPSYGYPAVPPNWESSSSLVERNKPTTQLFIKEFQQAVWGGVTDDRTKNTPASRTVEAYPNPALGYGVAKMEHSYWQRGLDSYTQIMQAVDVQIGNVVNALQALPQGVVQNTVIVFASDHGEYAGAHGLLQGKLGSVYEEAWRIPLIVVDPSGRFTADTDTIRTGLASSVDLSTMLVSLGHNGTRDWMQGDLADIYGSRLDIISMLKSASAPGRPYVLYATDEIAPSFFNFNNAPTHVLGLRTPGAKLGVYADWYTATSTIDPKTAQLEFYDYSTPAGRLEVDNTANSDPRAADLYRILYTQVIPNEMQQLLPSSLLIQQQQSKVAHLVYRAAIENLPLSVYQAKGRNTGGALRELLGYGADF